MARKNAKKAGGPAEEVAGDAPAQAASAQPRAGVDPELVQRFRWEVRVINFSTIFLTILFSLVGFSKISGLMLPDMHAMLVNDFKAYHAVWQLKKVNMDVVAFRVLIGMTEIFCAVALVTPHALPAAALLMTLMVGACYTHYAVGQPLIVPAVVLTLLVVMVSARLRVRMQLAGEERQQKTE